MLALFRRTPSFIFYEAPEWMRCKSPGNCSKERQVFRKGARVWDLQMCCLSFLPPVASEKGTQESECWSQTHEGSNSPFRCCVTLGKSLHLLVLQFPSSEKWRQQWIWGFTKPIHVEHLELRLAPSNCCITVVVLVINYDAEINTWRRVGWSHANFLSFHVF